MSVTILQLHKRASYEFKYIQDKFSISSDGKICALADGTTQSFNSEIWAEIITSQFVKSPSFIPNEIIQLFKQSIEQYKNFKFEFSENPAKASLEKAKQRKGSTATFIGLRFLSNNKVELISCGDSNFFLLSNNNITAYPFADLDSLDGNNNFINTEALVQEKIDFRYFNVNSFEYQYGDKLILATDALSRLIIKKPEILNELLQIEEFAQFKIFCTKYWDNKELQEDDISAIILNIDNIIANKIIIPPNNFSFPREKEEEFIPASLTQDDNEIKFTDMQMNEIRNQFNGIANDLHQIKKKQKFYEMLLMVAISLILISFLYAVFFQKSSTPEITESEMLLQQQLNDNANIIQSKQEEIDRLNKQLKAKDTTPVKKEIKPISKNDTLMVVNKPKATQNLKKENKITVKPIEKKEDSTTTKEQ